MLEKFTALGLSENILSAIRKKGFEEPTQIQEQTIPLLLRGNKDVVGHAQTGTGKTAAFGIPLIEKLLEGKKHVQALILVPTRELALQVAEEINSLKGTKKLKIIAIYGGQSIDQQLRHLRRGIDIVVGTPGRVKDHLLRKSLFLDSVSHAVLDEADEMLNMGFIEDVEEILSYTNKDKRMLLFCATMPDRILKLAKNHMKRYELIRTEKEQLTVSLTNQIYFEVRESEKLEALCRIIDCEVDFYGLVFCRTKVDVDIISKKLSGRGYDAEGLHGDISQHQRERILGRFRAKRTTVLVATDVAARGIDIYNLSHVINYALPQNPDMYIHRIGRTGRAGKGGTAVTFITPSEYRKLNIIKRITKTDIRKKRVPAVEEVIKTKKQRIKNDINTIIQSSDYKKYLPYAQEIAAETEPEIALAAFIRYTFQDDFDKRTYSRIEETSVDNQGKARLFIAKGRNDNINPRKLVAMIQKVAGTQPNKIDDVCVLDRYSFLTVPFKEAEKIVQAFKRTKGNEKSIVSHARKKDSAQQ